MDLNMSPVPTNLAVQIAELGEVQAVLMLVTTPMGMNGFFLADDQAIQIGNQMLNLGGQIKRDKSGLTVVKRGGIVVPGGQGAVPGEGERG